MRNQKTIWIVVLAVVSLSANNLFAQATASATLQGTVMDKSGAVIPNADVKITNKATGLVRGDTTGNTGNYRFELLPPGTYQVRISVKGFATGVYENVELAVGRTTTIDASLSPSQQAEVVVVEAAAAALVDVQKSDVSRAISPSEVVDLPSNSRDFVGLAALAPGARPVNSYDPTKNRIGVFAVNGSNGRNVNVTVNGIDNKDKTFLFFALEREREETSFPVTPTAFTELSLVTNLGAKPSQTIPTPYYDWRYNGRLDHRFNDKNSFSLSYTNQNNRGLNDQSTQTNDLTAGNFTTNQLIIANATLSSVLSPNIVNVATVGYQYWNNLIDSDIRAANFTFPDASFGTNGNVPQQSFQRKWQFKDDLSITKGKHSFKTGFDYLWEPVLGGFFIFNPTLTLTFFDN